MFEARQYRSIGGETIILKLITENAKDSDSSRTTGLDAETTRQNTYFGHSRTRLGVFAVEVLPLLLIITLPLSVHAGVFSSLVGMLKEDVVVYERDANKESVHDVQLLSATNSSDPKGGLGGGDVIVDAGALVSSGTVGEDEVDEVETFTGEISVYTVREGDTLSQIAEMFDVTANTILWANDVDGPTDIHPGQSLVILPIVGVRHVVKDGDTISSIAKKYEADADEVRDYNQLAAAEELSVGETLVIPGGEIAAPPAPTRSSSAPVQYTNTPASSSGSSAGFAHPAPGAIRTQGMHGYNGVDLAASYDSAIRAAAAGEVIVSKAGGWNGGYGNYIVVRHGDGTQTLYAHLSRNDVGVGQYVTQGEVIGGMGNSGRSTGTHLHFEVRGARNPF